MGTVKKTEVCCSFEFTAPRKKIIQKDMVYVIKMIQDRNVTSIYEKSSCICVSWDESGEEVHECFR